MAARFFSERNLDFLLYETLDVLSLTQFPYFAEHNRKTFGMILKAAGKLSRELLFPIFGDMDRNPPELVNGEVKVHPAVKKNTAEFAKGGWLSATFPVELDGDQLPVTVFNCCNFIFDAANYSANAYSGLTIGAARLIATYGHETLKSTYLQKMLSGRWQGTMALTEPEAGSSLSDITTGAEPTDEGYYRVKGQKIFISAGDHNATENVVHLMLVRLQGAPAGTKGISLMVVPKKRPQPDGTLVNNDIVASGVYHKLGYRGCPIVQLSIGDHNDCRGWLVGEPHQGLKYMFQMMNDARIHVGMGAVSKSTAAYYATLEYARTRRQGRKVGDKDPTRPQIPIIEHADVKRMLLFQRAVNEGGLSLLLQCSYYLDLEKAAATDADREKYNLLTEILTPIVKTYPAEMGIMAISQGLQCFGGSGYCDDYPLEQYYRDIRIDPIHEGTTGIQGMDLLGRKVVMNNGKALLLLLEEIETTIQRAETVVELSLPVQQLKQALLKLKNVTGFLLSQAGKRGAEIFLADATLYLEFFGLIAVAWQWLKQGLAAQTALNTTNPSKADLRFYQGKLYTLRYFFAYELPKIEGLATRLLTDDPITVEMPAECFDD